MFQLPSVEERLLTTLLKTFVELIIIRESEDKHPWSDDTLIQETHDLIREHIVSLGLEEKLKQAQIESLIQETLAGAKKSADVLQFPTNTDKEPLN